MQEILNANISKIRGVATQYFGHVLKRTGRLWQNTGNWRTVFCCDCNEVIQIDPGYSQKYERFNLHYSGSPKTDPGGKFGL